MKKNNAVKNGQDGLPAVQKLYNAALDAKAEDIVVLDVRGISGFSDYFIIMSGRSSRHVQGVATALEKQIRNKRLRKSAVEGFEDGHWVLLDFDDIIVHIFYNEDRKFYDIEGLWHDAPQIKMM